MEYVDPEESQEDVKKMLQSGTAKHLTTPNIPVVSHVADVDIGGKGCAKCGSLSHKHSTSKKCPCRFSSL